MGASKVGSRWQTVTALGLGAFALTNMAGDLLDLPVVKGLASASVIAPLPKVFSDVRGLETFASSFAFEITAPGQEPKRLPITPELYARLGGPYNRRNVYGVALAYAPRLPEPLWQKVYCYGLSTGGPLREELGLPPGASTKIAVTIETRTKGRQESWRLDPTCSR